MDTWRRRVQIVYFWVGVVLLLLASIAFLKKFQQLTILLCVSTLFATFLYPIVRSVQAPYRWVVSWGEQDLVLEKPKFSRVFSILLSYFLLGLIGGIFIWMATPLLQEQAAEVAAIVPELGPKMMNAYEAFYTKLASLAPESIRTKLDAIRPDADSMIAFFTSWEEQILSFISDSLGGIFKGFRFALSWSLFAVLVPLFGFYLLLNPYSYVRGIIRLFPWQHRPLLRRLLLDMGGSLSQYIQGQLKVCILIGLSTALLLWALGLNYAFLIGLFVGIFEVIPYFGIFAGLIFASLVAFAQKGIVYAIIIAVSMELLHWVESNFILPNIFGSALGLSPMVILVAVAGGYEIGGLQGMLFAIPFVSITKVLYDFIVTQQDDSRIEF